MIQQPPPFDIQEATHKKCEACGGVFFNVARRLGIVSAIAPSNKTGKEILVHFETHLCRECGHEFGTPVKGSD